MSDSILTRTPVRYYSDDAGSDGQYSDAGSSINLSSNSAK